MEDDRRKEAESAVKLASKFMMQAEISKVKAEVAYAAFGNAFLRMHLGLSKTKADWLEITKHMSEYFKD